MPTNIEIKVRIDAPAALQQVVESLADGPVEILDQTDIFFRVPAGRLKLRILGDHLGELILYHRDDADGPRPSRYLIAPTGEPETMRGILDAVLPGLGVVKKRRRLYRYGQTRVHLDQVEGLGHFVELEVVLRPDQSNDEGMQIAVDLAKRLGIAENPPVASAYIDLLREAPRTRRRE
jgi:predicted adenylyl cyclase CyaB